MLITLTFPIFSHQQETSLFPCPKRRKTTRQGGSCYCSEAHSTLPLHTNARERLYKVWGFLNILGKVHLSLNKA